MCTHDFDGGVVLIQVDIAHEHGCGGDDDFLHATLQLKPYSIDDQLVG